MDAESLLRKNVEDAVECYSKFSYEQSCNELYAAQAALKDYLRVRKNICKKLQKSPNFASDSYK